jgi:hypothetical protein
MPLDPLDVRPDWAFPGEAPGATVPLETEPPA